MKKTIFEQMGGTYTKVGDYYLPNLIPAEEETEIGLWGQRHLRTSSNTAKCDTLIC